jgi:hypothetical protein
MPLKEGSNMPTVKALAISTLLSIGMKSGLPAFARVDNADSSSVSKRLAVAKSLTLTLKADAAELTSFAGGNKDWASQLEMVRKISQDASKAKETLTELQEMHEIASPGQLVIIRRVTPLLRDLIDNTRLTLRHLEAGPGDADSGSHMEYMVAHEEISRHLSTLIVERLNKRRIRAKAQGVEP